MNDPYGWLQNLIEQVPELLRPLIVAAAGAIPYVEGEGSAALGILAGINPFVAAAAGAAGNILCVVAVVLVSSRVRRGAVDLAAARARSARARVDASGTGTSGVLTAEAAPLPAADTSANSGSRRDRGRAKLGRWLVRFGVPGASLLAPIALPTMLTAAFFVASGVRKEWVILWQVVAIVLWTGAVAAAATGVLAALGW